MRAALRCRCHTRWISTTSQRGQSPLNADPRYVVQRTSVADPGRTAAGQLYSKALGVPPSFAHRRKHVLVFVDTSITAGLQEALQEPRHVPPLICEHYIYHMANRTTTLPSMRLLCAPNAPSTSVCEMPHLMIVATSSSCAQHQELVLCGGTQIARSARSGLSWSQQRRKW